jgi:AbiV family abortive infection protein
MEYEREVKSLDKKPNPGDVLYKNLFATRDRDQTFAIISDGCTIILKNADRLVKDAKLLKDGGGYVSASFLAFTAREETAKSHILLDACRLDFSHHHNVLKRLCKAFYNHVAKYAYYKVLSFPALHDMGEIKKAWENATREWRPSEIESGEPDMPHETNYLREMPLYVDFSDWDEGWYNPQAPKGSLVISARHYQIDDAEEDLKLFRKTHELGLYKPESLSILNDTYKNLFITEKINMQEISSIYEKAGQQFEKKLAIPQTAFSSSFISKWPLYKFA